MANHWLKSGWIGDDTEKCDWLQMEKSFFLEALKTLNWKNQPHSSPEFVLNYLTPEPDGGAGGASGPALSLYCEHLLPTSCILSLPPLHPLLRTVFALKPGFLTWGPDSFLVFSLFLCFFACFCVFVCFFFPVSLPVPAILLPNWILLHAWQPKQNQPKKTGPSLPPNSCCPGHTPLKAQ